MTRVGWPLAIWGLAILAGLVLLNGRMEERLDAMEEMASRHAEAVLRASVGVEGNAEALRTLRREVSDLHALVARLSGQLEGFVPIPTPTTVQPGTEGVIQDSQIQQARVYADFADLPVALQEKMLPFFMGEPPGPGKLDAIYCNPDGFSVSMSRPALESERERALARLCVRLDGEARILEEQYVRLQVERASFAGVYRSSEEARVAMGGLPSATVREVAPGQFAVINLEGLAEEHPDYSVIAPMADQLSAPLTKPGRLRKSMIFLWEDSP